MSAKPDVTLLLLTRTLAARAEFAGGACVEFRKAGQNGERSMGAAVAAAAGEERPLRGPVWILCDDVYSQALTLAAGALSGLGEDDLSQAIGLEVQVLSGLSVAESVLGWRPLPGAGREREFWVAQAPKRDVEEAAAAVRQRGGRLEGVLHPAGLPRRLAEDPGLNGRWRRVEFWPEVSAVVEEAAEAGPVARLGRGAPPRGRPDATAAECLVAAPSAAALAQPAARTFRLEDDATLRAWLAAWAEVLERTPGAVPVLRVPERPPSVARRVAFAAGFAFLVAAACAAHTAVHASRREAARREWAAARAPMERIERARKSVAALEKRARELRGDSSAGLAGISGKLPARILEALSRRCPEGVVVESLEIAWDRSVVRGMAVEAGLIERLAGELARELDTEGCRTAPTAKKLRVEGHGAGFYEFEVQILSAAFRPSPPAPGREP